MPNLSTTKDQEEPGRDISSIATEVSSPPGCSPGRTLSADGAITPARLARQPGARRHGVEGRARAGTEEVEVSGEESDEAREEAKGEAFMKRRANGRDKR